MGKAAASRSANQRDMREILTVTTRLAHDGDLDAITRIYNEGIADRAATLETEPKSQAEVAQWLFSDRARYPMVVAEAAGAVIGWAALRPYSHRCAYAGVADLSVYVGREARGKGVGARLLAELEERARRADFHKIVLFTLPFNVAGQRLYRKLGFRKVGTFREQGTLDGRLVDVMAMEKILDPA